MKTRADKQAETNISGNIKAKGNLGDKYFHGKQTASNIHYVAGSTSTAIILKGRFVC
jgi:hypothetical protein